MGSPLYLIIQKPVFLAEKMIGLSLLALFAFCYVHGFWYRRYRVPFALLLILIIAYFSLMLDPNLLMLGFFSAALLGMLENRRHFLIGISGQLLLFAVILLLNMGRMQPSDWLSLLPPTLIISVFPWIMRMIRHSNELKRQLSSANEEIARLSKIEERQRISRDLHDTLGHTLSLITLKSELAEKLLTKKPERAAAEIKDIQTTSRSALQQVRDLVSGMNSLSIKEELLQARSILSAAGVRMQLEGGADKLDAPPLTQNILGLCLREAVNNVVKHSLAQVCVIKIEDTPGLLSLTISDNGTGAPPRRSITSTTGRGLLGMKERLELVQGRLEFRQEPGTGAVLTIQIPKILKTPSKEDF
ncbi:sensor histidine kinase [Paenibacillus sp. CAA11]|nr:sensor histidine kinase [Paenibacillus sp. CAA11]